MSEDKRTPISVYLTPRAAMILRDYNKGSGYGSLSRTVEEIILAFDGVYRSAYNAAREINGLSPDNPEQARSISLILGFALHSIQDMISRLQKASEAKGSM